MADILAIDRTSAQDYEEFCLQTFATSPGAAAAGGLVELDANGLIDSSFLPNNDKTATVDAVGVSKGDPLYISADGTVTTYPNDTNDKPIGFAAETTAAAGTVTIVTQGVITGVLTAATAGEQQYWDGTNHQTTVPSAVDTRIFPTGVAYNATDLCVQPIGRLKKNVA